MKQNNDKFIKGNSFKPNASIEEWYKNSLKKLTKEMTTEVYKVIKPEYKSMKNQITFDDSISSQMRIAINELEIRFRKKFKDEAKKLSKTLLNKLLKQTRFVFNKNIKKMLGDKSRDFLLKGTSLTEKMQEVVKASITENVNLITNIPEHYFKQITGAVMRSITNGLGTTHIEEELLKYEKMTRKRAENIARDQTHKAFVDINARNMSDNGMNYFIWRHMGAEKNPREYHQKSAERGGLNGKICDLRNPPIIDEKTGERGLPGQLPYCHCFMQPIIKFDDEEDD